MREWLRWDRRTLRSAVGVVCSGFGVVPMQFFWYNSFALAFDKLHATVSDDDLSQAATGLVDDWTRRALRRDVLSAIAAHVFNVEVEGTAV